MENLIINDFLIIEKAEIRIRKINVLIGPQASGKSIIAKLVYFFKSFLSEDFLDSIKNNENKSDLSKRAREKFENIFPSYAWDDSIFSIIYENEDYTVSIECSGTLSSFKLDYSKNLQSTHRRAKNLLKKEIGDNYELGSLIHGGLRNIRFKREVTKEVFKYFKLDTEIFQNVLFVPAGRSYFSILHQNIFSFLKQNGSVDPLFADFGSFYEFAKFQSSSQQDINENPKEKGRFTKYFEQLSESILKGIFVRASDKDWILSDKGVTLVDNSSSGQQESLPLLLTLKNWPAEQNEKKGGTLFIEEPEAHLFPESQKSIVELIAATRNFYNTNFFITTHSPYILTCLNTLIYAGQLSKTKNKNKVNRIVPEISQLVHSDIAAYSVKNGSAKNIFDQDLDLIDASIIDETSEEIGKEFDQLLELEE